MTSDGKRRPGRLDLSGTKNQAVPSALTSALLIARIIEEIESIQDPDAVDSPKPEINVNACSGMFVRFYVLRGAIDLRHSFYDGRFLLELFMVVSKEKPGSHPRFDAIRLEPVEQGFSMTQWRLARLSVVVNPYAPSLLSSFRRTRYLWVQQARRQRLHHEIIVHAHANDVERGVLCYVQLRNVDIGWPGYVVVYRTFSRGALVGPSRSWTVKQRPLSESAGRQAQQVTAGCAAVWPRQLLRSRLLRSLASRTSSPSRLSSCLQSTGRPRTSRRRAEVARGRGPQAARAPQ